MKFETPINLKKVKGLKALVITFSNTSQLKYNNRLNFHLKSSIHKYIAVKINVAWLVRKGYSFIKRF